MDRLAMLHKIAAERPDEAFPQYGLAMEYRRLQRNEEAVQAFDVLMQRHPDYVPAYLMAGTLLKDLGQGARARQVLDRGIEVATAAGESKAVDELSATRAELD